MICFTQSPLIQMSISSKAHLHRTCQNNIWAPWPSRADKRIHHHKWIKDRGEQETWHSILRTVGQVGGVWGWSQPSQAPGSFPWQVAPPAEPIFLMRARSWLAVPPVLTGIPHSVNTCLHANTAQERLISLWNTNAPAS